MARCAGSSRVALAIFGDPIVGRALALLLRGPRYDARFLPTSSVESGSPEGVGLVLLAPMPDLCSGRRGAIVASLIDKAAAVGAPVLELVPVATARER
jgi:hypothetical protein